MRHLGSNSLTRDLTWAPGMRSAKSATGPAEKSPNILYYSFFLFLLKTLHSGCGCANFSLKFYLLFLHLLSVCTLRPLLPFPLSLKHTSPLHLAGSSSCFHNEAWVSPPQEAFPDPQSKAGSLLFSLGTSSLALRLELDIQPPSSLCRH